MKEENLSRIAYLEITHFYIRHQYFYNEMLRKFYQNCIFKGQIKHPAVHEEISICQVSPVGLLG